MEHQISVAFTKENKLNLLEDSFGGRTVLKTDAVTNFLAENHVHLVSNTLCDRPDKQKLVIASLVSYLDLRAYMAATRRGWVQATPFFTPNFRTNSADL